MSAETINYCDRCNNKTTEPSKVYLKRFGNDEGIGSDIPYVMMIVGKDLCKSCADQLMQWYTNRTDFHP